MPSANTTNQLPLLKRLYGNKISEPLYKASRLVQMCQKDTSFGGEGRHVNVTIGPTSGGSANFADALASQDATQERRFFVTRRKEYQVFSIENEAIVASKGDKNAIVSILKQQTDKARYAHARAMAKRAWGHAGGALGQIHSGVTLASTTLTLRERSQITGFEPNMQLEFASDNGSATSPAGRRGAPDRLTVSTRNTATGVITTNANLSTVTGITVNDFVFRRGDYANAMTGAQGWCPTAAPGGTDNFFGVNRSTGDVQRQSGIRVAFTTDLKTTLQNAMAECQLAGGDTMGDYVCFVNPLDYATLLVELGAKREFQGKSDGDIGFTFIEVHGALGSIRVVSEVDVIRGFGWMVDTKTVYLRTAGECPMNLAEGYPGGLLTASDDDVKQGRIGCYGNFFWEDPGTVAIVAFS